MSTEFSPELSPQLSRVYSSQQTIIQNNPEIKNQITDYLVLNLVEDSANNNFYKNLYEVAALTSIIAFTIISASALVVCTIFAPAYTPFVLIGVVSALLPIFKNYIYDPLKQKADFYQLLDFNSKNILEKMKQLSGESEGQVLSEIFATGAQLPSSPAQLALMERVDPEIPLRTVLPLVARYKHWEEVAEKTDQAARQILGDIQTNLEKLNAETSEAKKEKIQNTIQLLEGRHYQLVEAGLLTAKVKAAFILYLISHIDQKVSLNGEQTKKVDISDFGKCIPLEYHTRKRMNDYEFKNTYFIRNGNDPQEISRDFLLASSIEEISRYIFDNNYLQQPAQVS